MMAKLAILQTENITVVIIKDLTELFIFLLWWLNKSFSWPKIMM
jgi:hypothetical protein